MTVTVTVTWATLGTLAAAVVCVAAVLPGTWQAAHGRFYASPVTWTAWAALGVVALVSQIRMGGVPQIVLCTVLGFSAICMAVVANTTTWFARTRRGVRWRVPRAPACDAAPWHRYVDVFCAGGSAAAFTVMLLAPPEVAILLAILTDLIAAIPTLATAWTAPGDQPAAMFAGVAISSGLAAVAEGTPARLIEVAYPLYVYVLCTAVAAVIAGRRGRLDRPGLTPPAPVTPWGGPETPYNAYVRDTLSTRPPITGATNR